MKVLKAGGNNLIERIIVYIILNIIIIILSFNAA